MQWFVLAIKKGKRKRSQISVELGFILHHLGITRAPSRTEEFLSKGIEEDNFCRVVRDDNGIADVFNYEIEPIAVLAHHFLGSAKLLEICAYLLIGSPQIGDIAHDRDHAGARLAHVGGSANGFEQNLFAVHYVDQSKIAGTVGRADDH